MPADRSYAGPSGSIGSRSAHPTSIFQNRRETIARKRPKTTQNASEMSTVFEEKATRKEKYRHAPSSQSRRRVPKTPGLSRDRFGEIAAREVTSRASDSRFWKRARSSPRGVRPLSSFLISRALTLRGQTGKRNALLIWKSRSKWVGNASTPNAWSESLCVALLLSC